MNLEETLSTRDRRALAPKQAGGDSTTPSRILLAAYSDSVDPFQVTSAASLPLPRSFQNRAPNSSRAEQRVTGHQISRTPTPASDEPARHRRLVAPQSPPPMSSSEPDAEGAPGARVLARALDKVIKHSSWRRHAALVAASKSALDLLSSAPDEPSDPASPVPGLPAPAADAALGALLLALDPGSPKVAEPALECVAGLLSLRLLQGDVDAADPSASSPPSPASRLFAAVLSCVSLGGGGDDALELAVLRVLVAFARCPGVSVSGECLGQVVKACYNVYLGSASGGNQLCAKLPSCSHALRPMPWSANLVYLCEEN